MKSYKDYCPFNTMNVRHLTLTLAIAIALNSPTSPAQSSELVLTIHQFSQQQIKLQNPLKSALSYYRSFPLPNNKGLLIDISDEIEFEVEDEIEDEVEDEIEDKVKDEIENQIEDEIENTILEQSEDILLERVTETTTAQIDDEVSQVANLEVEKIYSDDWFVLADQSSLNQLQHDGYSISNKEYLDGLGLYLANLNAPASFDLKPENYTNLMALNTSNRAIDVNHLYELAQSSTTPSRQNLQAKTASQQQKPVHHRIGIIDSAVNQSHPVLINSQIITRQFAEQESQGVFAHGTAVASILIGKSNNYRGMLPGQPLWAATVVFSDQTGSQMATTISLVRAINWLIQSDVDIINISLAGPDNRLLQIAINRACSDQIIIVTAAGNNGPAAKPQYPAAYACTIAVTAIDSHNRIYRRAARGSHIDLAAYGVNVLHADASNTFAASSGTSFAAPLVSSWLAANMPLEINKRDFWLKQIMTSAEDLGAVGKDPVYGFGTLKSHPGKHLINPQINQKMLAR